MNELFRVNCKTDYSVALHTVLLPTKILGILTYDRLFIFYEDRFEMRKGDEVIITIPYANIVQDKTGPINKGGIIVCFRDVGRTPSQASLSILKLSPEDRDKILDIIKR